jgi:hypothetical protein
VIGFVFKEIGESEGEEEGKVHDLVDSGKFYWYSSECGTRDEKSNEDD